MIDLQRVEKRRGEIISTINATRVDTALSLFEVDVVVGLDDASRGSSGAGRREYGASDRV